MIPPPPRSTLFPYTTLFRSVLGGLESSLQVRPRGKAAPGARDQHRAHRVLSRLALDRLLQLAAELRRPRVQRVRPVERQPPHGASLLPDDRLIAHCAAPFCGGRGAHDPAPATGINSA